TPYYMSPEQAAGSEDVDARSDIYALGCVLYEMLAGQPPFVGPSPQSVMQQHITAEPPRITQARPEVPAEVTTAVARALKKSPADRYATAAQFALELERIRKAPGLPAAILSAIRQPKIAATAVAIMAALVMTSAWLLNRNRRIRWAEEQALPQIVNLIGVGDHLAAYRQAEEAERYIPDHPMLTALWPRIATEYSITTDPADAEIYFKDYSAPDGEWAYLGRSPLARIRFPIGVFRWRIRKEGYETVETVHATPEAASGLDSVLSVTLHERGSVPPTMARVSARRLRVDLGYLRRTEALDAPAYLIDKYEVTNAQFKEFVDAGGYTNRDYWKHDIVTDGTAVPWDAAMAAFRDRTGRRGPATWEAGTYPDGQENYPVGGISWYEAVAYAEFVGKSLPTVYHWSSAADTDHAQIIIAHSNYGGEPAPVGSHPGVGAHGLYDMAGNVREWCWNAEDDSRSARYILGGGWGDPSYVFRVADSRPPWDRSPENGVRLVEYIGGEEAVPQTAFRPLPRSYFDFRTVTPVSDEQFQFYRDQLYAYDRTELHAAIESVDESVPLWRKEKITFDAAYGGEQVTAYLFTPNGIEPPYQTVIYFPTGIARSRNNSDQIDRQQGLHSYFWEFLVMSGRALLYPVYKGTYERRFPRGSPSSSEAPVANRDWRIQLSKDFRRSIDYLETRSDIDQERLAYYGVSWGANMGPINVALEDRVRTAVFLLGGFGAQLRPDADPVNFAPHVRIPVLMINGEHDYAFPIKTSAFPMFDFLGTPDEDKMHRVYPGGHGMWGHFGHQARQEILDWLDRYLGPVN
ncbi:MAG: SUMF1/EgtB/PvdO family nonheme iron enzyme, partial [Phycisphaerae bacterium]